MRLCESAKKCGFKSSKELASLCGVSTQYLNRIFISDKHKCRALIETAAIKRIRGVIL